MYNQRFFSDFSLKKMRAFAIDLTDFMKLLLRSNPIYISNVLGYIGPKI